MRVFWLLLRFYTDGAGKRRSDKYHSKPTSMSDLGRVLLKSEDQIAPSRMSAMEKCGLKMGLTLADHHRLLCVRSDQTTSEAAAQRSGRFVS